MPCRATLEDSQDDDLHPAVIWIRLGRDHRFDIPLRETYYRPDTVNISYYHPHAR